MKKLYIFDLDGTLVEKYGSQPLPNVQIYLERLAIDGYKLAIASNQAGLAWRIMTGDQKYPDVVSMARRFEQITQEISSLADVPWFVSVVDDRVKLSTFDYKNLAADLEKACPSLNLIVRSDPQWRKPQPGMLLSALQYFNIEADNALFIGDYETDAEAAISAGIPFCWADAFFNNRTTD
jgi:HAD superfamily hydrolase (TIGR01662 family)